MLNPETATLEESFTKESASSTAASLFGKVFRVIPITGPNLARMLFFPSFKIVHCLPVTHFWQDVLAILVPLTAREFVNTSFHIYQTRWKPCQSLWNRKGISLRV